MSGHKVDGRGCPESGSQAKVMNAERAQWFVIPLETVENAIRPRQTSPSASPGVSPGAGR